ncbi:MULTISPECIES: YqzL family protein [unclassified Virgibacillus]|uniref:YqzL family protein n=1 Tax=unclassified Virgibacillus TaxID=2620237 RepID=UPI0024DE5FD5|nr:YqzL family protein [Virgibacillus sp. LDC-1]
MIDLTWKLFSQTGNIETYLLLKELEKESDTRELELLERSEPSTFSSKNMR